MISYTSIYWPNYIKKTNIYQNSSLSWFWYKNAYFCCFFWTFWGFEQNLHSYTKNGIKFMTEICQNDVQNSYLQVLCNVMHLHSFSQGYYYNEVNRCCHVYLRNYLLTSVHFYVWSTTFRDIIYSQILSEYKIISGSSFEYVFYLNNLIIVGEFKNRWMHIIQKKILRACTDKLIFWIHICWQYMQII